MRASTRVRRLATRTAVAAGTLGALAGAFCGGLVVAGGGHHGDHGGVVDEAAQVIRSKADAGTSMSVLDSAAIRGMLSQLDDRWATYYGVGNDAGAVDSLQALLDGRYSGLGIWLRRADSGSRQVVVASVTAGSPAARAGLQVGDEIVAVDGQSVAGADTDAVAAALRGPSGSNVRLQLAETSGARRDVALARVDLPASPVSTQLLTPQIERIRIATFAKGVGADVAADVARARKTGVQAFVLDLRGNPGGLLDEAVRTASVFLNGGPVVSLQGRSVPFETLNASRGGDTTTPLAVLVDGGTASAAEVLSGALSDRGRAVLVGSKTFGKGSVQQVTHLSDGSVLELTVATYTTPDGAKVDGVGITPDVRVAPTESPEVAAERAVAILQALIADRN
jgi:carboxyl-terminal processing protease